ncbi:MAG: TetR/AcrR family transcriptional regulator [Nitrospirota bacterium]
MVRHKIIQKYRISEILKAARKVIAKKGWEKATIEEIAEKAGVAKGTVYIYFKNKDELFSSALLDVMDRVIDAIEKEVNKNDAITKKLEAIVKIQLSFIEKERNFLRVFLAERPMTCIGSGDELNRLMYEKKEKLIEILSGIIKEGIKQGKFKRTEPRYVAYFLMDLIRGAAFYKLMNVSKEPTPYNLKSIINFYIRSLVSGR